MDIKLICQDCEYPIEEHICPDMIQSKSIELDELRKIIMNTNCNHCDYDEAEGKLYNHCDSCCRKIVTKISKLLNEQS